MDIEEYIHSGIIENYVLGATTAEENAEIERLAGLYPEIRKEIEENRTALEQYILQYEQSPPTELKDKILGSLDELESGEDKTEKEGIHRLITDIQSSENQKIFLFRPYLVAASYTLLALSIILNIYFYNNWQNIKGKLTLIEQQNLEIARNLDINKANYQRLSDEMAILRNPANQFVDLKALPEFPNASVAVYWNKESQKVYLQIKNLPPPPQGKQYQLWAIKGDKIQDAGVFDISGDKALAIHSMKAVAEAEVFAVTLEKEGGVPQPEGAMCVKGKV